MTGPSSWIVERWLEPLVASNELRKPLRKGRVTARKGWVKNLTVRPGLVTADVRNDSGQHFSVKLRRGVGDESTWDGILEAVASSAGHAARLLGGEITPDIVKVFEAKGVELFPFGVRDVKSFCSCREEFPVCSHAVATHVALAQAIAADPFVILELAGRDREAILDGLRARREFSDAEPDDETDSGSPDMEASESLIDGYWARGVVPTLAFRFGSTDLQSEETVFPVLRALGPGPGGTPPDEVADVFAPVARMALKRLDDVIQSVTDDEDDGGQAPDPTETLALDDLLVAAAHQHGYLTTGFVADALGIPATQARKYLQWLVDEGRLRQTGRARGSRYLPGENEVAPSDSPSESDEPEEPEPDQEPRASRPRPTLRMDTH